ncbi:MAG: hypothetical protein AAF717_18990 [Bacteroidota bacterium]
MISNFLSRTKPINYAFLFGSVFLFFWLFIVLEKGFDLLAVNLINTALGILALIAGIYLLGQTSKENKLTNANSFAMFFFVALMITYPRVFPRTDLIYCNLLLIASSYRVLAIKNGKGIKEKIFEASLCVLAASFFYEWALLFFIPIYATMFVFDVNKIRLWLMPLAAFVSIALITFTVLLSVNNTAFFWNHFQYHIHLEAFSIPNYGVFLYLSLSLVLAVFVFWKLGYRRLGRTLSLRIILIYLFIAILAALFTGSSLKEEIMLTFFPVAIFLGNFVETIRKDRFKELFLTLVIALPLISFIYTQLQ